MCWVDSSLYHCAMKGGTGGNKATAASTFLFSDIRHTCQSRGQKNASVGINSYIFYGKIASVVEKIAFSFPLHSSTNYNPYPAPFPRTIIKPRCCCELICGKRWEVGGGFPNWKLCGFALLLGNLLPFFCPQVGCCMQS